MDSSVLNNRLINVSLLLWALIIMFLFMASERDTPPGGPEPPGGTSPRGLLFLRASGLSSELWAADVDGAHPRQIADNVLDFDVQPGGEAVVYTAEQGGSMTRVEVLELSSGVTRTLLADPQALPARPLWSPAGGIIAYERRTITQTGAGAPKVWLMQDDGTALGPMLAGADIVTYGPVWSPDGTRIIASDPVRNELVLFNFTEVSQRIRLSGEFDWSPDGKRLIVAARDESEAKPRSRLVLVDLTTNQQTQLPSADPSADDYMPRWSPDGAHIVFVRRNNQQRHGELWLLPMSAEGVPGKPWPLTNESGYANMDPIWSPAGSTLIWTRFAIGAGGAEPTTWHVDVRAQPPVPALLLEHGSGARWIR